MINFGIVRPGSTLYIPFDTYSSNNPTASITAVGLAVTDIEVYKDSSIVQRLSDSGYTLLDTDGIDLDGLVGINGFSMNLADNTTAGFYVAGSNYRVVVSSITVDAGTINFTAATFTIGMPGAIINTTIASLVSQTTFNLTSGPAENDALVGCPIYLHGAASAVQCAFGVVSAYIGATKTVGLLAAPTFTIAAGDNACLYFPTNRGPGGVYIGDTQIA